MYNPAISRTGAIVETISGRPPARALASTPLLLLALFLAWLQALSLELPDNRGRGVPDPPLPSSAERAVGRPVGRSVGRSRSTWTRATLAVVQDSMALSFS